MLTPHICKVQFSENEPCTFFFSGSTGTRVVDSRFGFDTPDTAGLLNRRYLFCTCQSHEIPKSLFSLSSYQLLDSLYDKPKLHQKFRAVLEKEILQSIDFHP